MSAAPLDTRDFEAALYEEGKQAFPAIIGEYGSDLYIIGLYHFGGWDGVMPVFNTRSALADAAADDAEALLVSKWNPADYPYLEDYAEYFTRSELAIQKLGQVVDESPDTSSDFYQQCWQQTLAAMEAVLQRLDSEGVFRSGLKRDEISLCISTYDESSREQYSRICRLNASAVLAKIGPEFEDLIAAEDAAEEEAWSSMLESLAVDGGDENH